MKTSIKTFVSSLSAEDKFRFLEDFISAILEAQNIDLLHQFLTDFEFFISKIEDERFGVQSLLSDFDSVIQADFDTEGKILSAVRKAIQLSADAILKDTLQTYPQIYARLPIPDHIDLLNSYVPNYSWLRIISNTLRTETDSLLQILGEGHTGLIDGCAISDDATIGLSASRDTTLRIWDLRTGYCNHVLTGHTDRVNACALSGDGLLALSASDDGTLRVWDVKRGSCLHLLDKHTDKVTDCSLSKNGEIAISSSKDGTVRVWNTSTGECTLIFLDHTNYVTCCSLSNDGMQALSGSCDRTLRLWDTQTGECGAVFENELSAIIDCALSGDGHVAISISDAFWMEQDTDSERPQFIVQLLRHQDDEPGNQDGIDDIDMNTFPSDVKENLLKNFQYLLGEANISPDASRENTLLKVWDCKTRECTHIFEDSDGSLATCDLSKDAAIAISGTTNGRLRVWDLVKKECRSVLKSSSIWLSSCSLSRQGDFALAVSVNLDFRLWNLREILEIPSMEHSQRTIQPIVKCQYDRDGNVAISVSQADIIAFWDSKTGNCLGEIEMEGSHWTHYSSISTESKVLLVFSMIDLTGKIPVINLLTGETIRFLIGHTSPVFHGEISEDGNIAISGSSDQSIRIWNIRTGECLHIVDIDKVSLGEVSSCAINADGRIFLAGFTTGILKLWSTQDGSCLKTLKWHENKINCCLISRNGDLFLSSSEDTSLLIWNLDDRNFLHKIYLDPDVLHHATFSSDGKLLLYASARQTIQIFSIETAEVLVNFSFDSWISSLAFSPTGSEIMVGDYSGSVHFMSIEGVGQTQEVGQTV
jgi:WD40 repeat protein